MNFNIPWKNYSKIRTFNSNFILNESIDNNYDNFNFNQENFKQKFQNLSVSFSNINEKPFFACFSYIIIILWM